MKSFKKITAILIAFILTFSVLGLVSSAADEVVPKEVNIPSYNAEDLTFKPTYVTKTTVSDKSLEDELGDFIKDEFGDDLGELGDDIKDEVNETYGIMNFFRKAFRAFIELFEHIADLLYPKM